MRIELPHSQVSGIHADGVTVANAPGRIVLDFLTRDDHAEDEAYVVTSRVRMDPTAMQAALAIMSQALDDYERDFGSAV